VLDLPETYAQVMMSSIVRMARAVKALTTLLTFNAHDSVVGNRQARASPSGARSAFAQDLTVMVSFIHGWMQH
jgi:hypothetical protein